MMYNAVVVSPIIGNGVPGEAYRPQFSNDYPIISWVDDTSRAVVDLPGLPVCILVCALNLDSAQVTAIEADSRYFVVYTEEVLE